VLLRIEDVDTGRARTEFSDGQRRDLDWLGLHWDEEVTPQSQRDYTGWASRLSEHTYRCTCTRKQRTHSAHACLCDGAENAQGSLRFRLAAGAVSFTDRVLGPQEVDAKQAFGDPVLQRSDGVWAYNLAVVADDIADGVTEVVRGADLLQFTAVQIQLWSAFGATPPTWLHAPLVVGPDGRKLSKSHGATEVGALRDAGWSAAQVWAQVLPWLGLHTDNLSSAKDAWNATRVEVSPISWGPPTNSET
jgi:glutamyl/glutaminyl-tRNA synthetase